MGKCRPTLRSTLNLLVKAELFRAADYIAVNLLNEQPPSRPENGLAANIDISEEEIAKLLKRQQLMSDDFETESTCYDFEESYEDKVIQIEYASGSYVENLCPAKCAHSNSDNVSKLNEDPITNNSKISQEQTSDSNFIKFSSSVTREQQDDQSNKEEVIWKQIEDSNEETAQEQVHDCKEAVALKQDENYTNEEVSNLKENEKEASKQDHMYGEELMSQALPLCVADFGRGVSVIEPGIMSYELPVFVNEVARQKKESEIIFSSSNDSDSNYTTSLSSSNLPVFDAIIPSNSESHNLHSHSDNNSNSNNNLNNNNSNISLPVIELTSSELPQVIVELSMKNK
ncbi:myb-like protein P isoform X2 [Cephus cinctus]|nr:myb-like protein P isoform X2 [Cephus cinctus]